MENRIYPKYFRRIRFWLAWLFGGNFKHPDRGMGWMPSLRRRTLRWKTEMGRGYTWWEFVKPPCKSFLPKPVSNKQVLRMGEMAQRTLNTPVTKTPSELVDKLADQKMKDRFDI